MSRAPGGTDTRTSVAVRAVWFVVVGVATCCLLTYVLVEVARGEELHVADRTGAVLRAREAGLAGPRWPERET